MSETTAATPLSYEPDAVLTIDQVAAWLRVSERQVYRLPIKRVQLGRGCLRFLAKHVYEYLDQIAAA